MRKSLIAHYDNFQKQICSYCDNQIGEKILLPVFINLWDDFDVGINKKDLYILTCKIINELVSKKVLKEDFEDKGFDTIYFRYKIFPHKDLIQKSFIKERVFD